MNSVKKTKQSRAFPYPLQTKYHPDSLAQHDIHQSSLRHELVDNGGLANFKLLPAIQNARVMAQILESHTYKVCYTPLLKFVMIEPFLRILGKSAIFSQCLVTKLWRHQILVYKILSINLRDSPLNLHYKYTV